MFFLPVDPPLTQDGYLQAFNVLSKWQEENSLADGENIGIPNISYVSPMTRALVTNSITFATQLNASGGPTIQTVVHEVCTFFTSSALCKFGADQIVELSGASLS